VSGSTHDHTPLAGVSVLEYGTGVGAGYCAALLAQLGAEVVKVATVAAPSPHAPTALRARAEALLLDAGKRVVEIEVGGDEFRRLFTGADIVVRGCDPCPGTAAELRVEYEQWRGDSDSLVFVALTPFGVVGPGSGWHGGDLNAQSLSGWTSIVGNPDEPPLSMNYGIGAMQHGLNAAGAALAALLERGAGRGGEFVDVSEADVIAACMRMYSLTYRFLQIPLKRNGLRAPGSSGRYPHTLLPCKDGYISTICRSPTDWGRFVEMMGNPSWAGEPRYQDFYAMGVEYPDEVDALIVPWLMRHTKDELGELATKYRVPLAPVRTVDEVLDDPQFAHRDFFRDRDAGDRTVRVPGPVAHWSGVDDASPVAAARQPQP